MRPGAGPMCLGPRCGRLDESRPGGSSGVAVGLETPVGLHRDQARLGGGPEVPIDDDGGAGRVDEQRLESCDAQAAVAASECWLRTFGRPC